MQILWPISDISVSPSGGWTPFPASPTTLFDKIDDGGGVADDGGTISSASGTFVEHEFTVGLTAGAAPATPGTCTVYVTAAKQTGNAALQDLVVEIHEGATVRATHTFTTIADTATEMSFTFSSSAIASSWSTLRLYIRRAATATACFVTVYSARVEAPDPGFEHMQVSGPGFQIAAAGAGHYLVPEGPGFKRIDGLEVAGAFVPDATATGFKVS